MRVELGDYVEEETREDLPDGAYYFTVLNHEVQDYQSPKIQPCERVVLNLNIKYKGRPYKVRTNLILDTSLIWKTTDFLASIGRKPQNGKYQIDFNGIEGRTGIAVIKNVIGRDGNSYLNVQQFAAGPEDHKLKGQSLRNAPPGYTGGRIEVDLDEFEELPF